MNKNNRKGIMLIIVAGAAALMLSACAGAAAPAPAAGNQQRNVIAVSGQGEASGAPDIAYVQLGIESSGGDLDAAIEEANSTMAAIREAVANEGVADEDMQTTRFNVYTEEPRDELGQPSGQPIYRVSNQLRVTVRDINTVGDVIGAGLDAGANAVNGLSFGIEDTTELQEEARQKAVEDARARAEGLAEGLGVTVGDPVYVSESYGGGAPMVERAMADSFAAGAAPPISEGQLSVSVSVQVEFEIGQ